MAKRFREFEVDKDRRRLLRRGRPLDVGQLTLDLLIYLIDNSDRVVPREELRLSVWNGRRVSPSAIPTAVNALRKALSDPAGSPELVQTVYGHGYRWIGPVTDSPAMSVQISSSLDRQFFGRRYELEELGRLFERASGEGRTALLIIGEPGIGKSRLLQEAELLAERRGFVVASGRCEEVSGAPTMQPWREILSQLGLGELSSLVAGLKLRANDSPESAGAARFELLEELSRGLAMRSASQSPTLLIFDDLQKADVPTLLLLEGMISSTRPRDLWFVAAQRPHCADERESDVLRRLRVSTDVLSLELSGLQSGDAEELIRERARFEVDPETVEALVRKSGGNPLFLEHLVRQLNAAPSASQRSLVVAGGVQPGAALVQVIQEAFSSIGEERLEVLRAASILGREFELGMVARLCEMPELAALEQLVSPELEYIVEEMAPGSFRFHHVLHRDAIYMGIHHVRRARMHKAVLSALREQHKPLAGEAACQAVPHALALPTTEDASYAIELLEAAARWSEINLGFEEAAAYLREALSAAKRARPGDLKMHAEIYARLGGAQRRSGDPEGAASSFGKAAELARLLDEPEMFAKAALGLAPGFFAIEAGVIDDQLIEMLEECLKTLSEDHVALRARVTGRLAMALYWSEHAGDCRVLGDRSVELASSSGDSETVAFALTAREVSRWGPEGAQERASLSEWAIGLAEQSGDRETELVYRLYRLTSLLQMGCFDVVWKELEVFSRRALASLHGGALWYRELILGLRAMMRGEWQNAERFATEFVRLGRSVRDRNADNCAVIHAAYRQIEYGEEPEARRLIDMQAGVYPRVRSYECGRVYLAAAVGDEMEARRRLRHLVSNDTLRLPRTVEWMIGVALLSEACHILRDRKRARVLYEALSPYEDEFVVVVFSVAVWRPVSYFLGRLADTMGRHEDAERLFEKARKQSSDLEAAPWEAHSLFGHAELLRRRAWPGDGARARELAQEAKLIAERLGMAPLLRRIEVFLWGPSRAIPPA